MTKSKSGERSAAASSPVPDGVSPPPPSGAGFFEVGPAEVLELLLDVRQGIERATDDMLDGALYAAKLNVASPYEVGILRRCAEHQRELLTLWTRRAEAELARQRS